MASMVFLRSRPRSFLRASAHYCSSYSRSLLFSSSTSPPDSNHGNPQNTENNQSNTRSSFNNLKSDLRDGETNQQPPLNPFSSKLVDKIRNKEYQSNVLAPQSAAPAGQFPSFQEIYRKSFGESRPADRSSSPLSSMASIKESLRRTNVSEIENKHIPQPSETSFAGLRETIKMVQQRSYEKDGMNSGGQAEDLRPDSSFPLVVEQESTVPSPLSEASDNQVEEISPAATEISADHQLTKNRDENLPVAPSAPSSPKPKKRKRNVVKRVAIRTSGKEENVMPSDSLVSSHLQPGLGESDLRKLETPKTHSLAENEYESAILIDGRNSIDWVRHYFEDIEKMLRETNRSLNEEKDKRRQNE